MKTEVIVLGKLKFDLRDSDESLFAQHELSSILGTQVEPIKTLPALFKSHPFNKMDDYILHIISRNLYLGEIQGYLAKAKNIDISRLIHHPAFFREIYLIVENVDDSYKIRQNLSMHSTALYQEFITATDEYNKIFVFRLFPSHTLFEYVTDVKKLPEVAINNKKSHGWAFYFTEKEKGIEQGLKALINHLKNNYSRAPHFGLGKRHIGDFVDWASTDLRKPFLHYLHKYKGKGDPRISRALLNLLGVKKGDTIIDPFVGSGAFIADAPTMGINAIGVELLAIGKLISEVKCNLDYNIEILKEEVIKLFDTSFENMTSKNLFNYSNSIDNDVSLLKDKLRKVTEESRQFINIVPHLRPIVAIKKHIDRIEDEKIRKLFTVLLSQKIVEFSEKKRSNNFIESFKSYVEDRYLTLFGTIKLANLLGVRLNSSKVNIVQGDSTNMDFVQNNSIDGILTSPPYFDALDYVGNNKISLVILGLDDDLKHGSTKDYYSKFEFFNIDLPESSNELINLLRGSRRSAKAKTVENYLKMMKLSFKECFRVLKPGGIYAMVVSKYHTWTINGQEQQIETSRVIADLGISEGFELSKVIQHGLSKADKGKINVEDILLFRKP